MLGSDRFRERDAASRELAGMGRFALPVIEQTLAETSSAEVRARCEALRPQMEQEELKARLDAFNADTKGQYDHKLPGWEKFTKQVGNTTATRKLFSEMYEQPSTARLLVASAGPKEEFAHLVIERRTEMYNRMYGRQRFVAVNGVMVNERHPPEPTDVAGLLYCEGLLGSVTDGRGRSLMSSILMQSAVTRDLMNDTPKGEAMRKLVGFWCETRTDPVEIYHAMTLSANPNLNLKGITPVKYALKLLETKGASPFYKAYAVCALAKAGGKEQLPNIKKLFDDKTVIATAFVNNNGVVERAEMQVGDIALAMALLVTNQKPEDYGFIARANLTDDQKYSYTAYRFPHNEKRVETFKTFKKWDESQAKPKK